MTTARWGHSAAFLPNGKVLVVGSGSYSLSTELYNPATGTWTATGALNTGHDQAPVTLLLNGKVLVAGGAAGDRSMAELYDPATGTNGTWAMTSALNAGRVTHSATLLTNGNVLVAGGQDSGYLSSAELYDVGVGFANSWQPQIANLTSPLNLGSSFALTGSQFRGISEGSGGNGSQDSAADYPVVQLRAIESGQTLFLSSKNWQTNSFISLLVINFPPGYALATLFVNGIPSASSILQIAPTPTAILLADAKELPSAALQFGFTNTPGAVFTALAATNVALALSNWTALGGVTEISSGQFQFTDTQASNYPRRFYRVRSP